MATGYQLVESDELRLVVEDVVRKTLIGVLPSILERATARHYLTQADVAGLTGWTARQLAYRRSSGDIPYIKRGRTIWYRTSDVYQWIDEGYVPSRRRDGR